MAMTPISPPRRPLLLALRHRQRVLAKAVAGVALVGIIGCTAAYAQDRAGQPQANAGRQDQQPRASANQDNGQNGEQPNRPHAGMLRFPDVSQDSIVFSYANDLWTVPKEGGMARPLASPPGPESFPKFTRFIILLQRGQRR